MIKRIGYIFLNFNLILIISLAFNINSQSLELIKKPQSISPSEEICIDYINNKNTFIEKMKIDTPIHKKNDNQNNQEKKSYYFVPQKQLQEYRELLRQHPCKFKECSIQDLKNQAIIDDCLSNY